jgi:hypothetical protein
MDQLVNQITQQVGIPRDKAMQAVQLTIGYLKNQLPPQISSQLDSLLGGQMGGQGMGGIAGQAQQTMGDMFGQGQTRP